MTRPSESKSPSSELMERARLTLQAIQFRERAATYKAAAATLRAAMLHAEGGNPKRLQEWLEQESHQFDYELGVLRPESLPDVSQEPPFQTIVSTRFDQPHIEHEPVLSESSFADAPCSPWERMEKAAIARLNGRQTGPSLKEAEFHSYPNLAPATKADVLIQPKARMVASEWESIVPDRLKVLIEGIKHDASNTTTKRWWKVPHVWVSLVAHTILVVCLALFAISAAKEPAVLSIVSSNVEAENVLMETPMESFTELNRFPESVQTAPTLASDELHTKVSIEDVSILRDLTTSTQHYVPQTIASSVTEAAQSAIAGSKMLACAEFFGAKATGNTFVYIVDSSPSMRRDGAFEAARKEIVRSLMSMKQKQRYFVSFFGREIDPMVFEFGVIERYPVYANPENLTKTIDWLGRVQVQKEGLPPNNALTEAIAMQPDGIFLLFDGDTKVDVAKHLRRVNRTDDIISAGLPKVPLHVIHFYQEEFQVQMRQVASENGGTYRFIPRPERPSKGNR